MGRESNQEKDITGKTSRQFTNYFVHSPPPLEIFFNMPIQGQHGVTAWVQRPDYATYKSPYGPNYKTQPHFHGINAGRAMKFGITAGSFGAVAGIFALFFFSDVPKVRKDIMQKLPVIGDQFVREIPPSDNPF